jgi:hypothetical protein
VTHLGESAGTFNLPCGAWIRLFRASGLIVEDVVELRPAAGATSSYRDDDDRAWARSWPMDEIWRLRKLRPREGRRDSHVRLCQAQLKSAPVRAVEKCTTGRV